MPFFRRNRNQDVQVRILEAGPAKMMTTREIGAQRREHPRDMRLEVRGPNGVVEVDKTMWVPEWVGVEQLVTSRRELKATCAPDDPSELDIDWEQIEADVTADVFAKLFHKQGPPEERLALLEDLYARGQFKQELYEKARRDLQAEMGG